MCGSSICRCNERPTGRFEQSIEQQGCAPHGTDQQAVIDPSRMVARCLTHRDACEIGRDRRKPHIVDPNRIQHQAPQRSVETRVSLSFNQLAHQEIANIGVAPAHPRTVQQIGYSEHDPEAPAQTMADRHESQQHGTRAGCRSRQAQPGAEATGGSVYRLTIDCVVQTEPAILHQGQSGRGDHCLGEAPPRNDAFAAVLGCSHAVPADGVQASVLF